MTTKQIYICDHCDAECTDNHVFSLGYNWRRPNAQFCTDNVHGCTREHTILAVAKILGIGVDGKAAEMITRLLADEKTIAESHAANLRMVSAELAAKNAHIAELEKERGILIEINDQAWAGVSMEYPSYAPQPGPKATLRQWIEAMAQGFRKRIVDLRQSNEAGEVRIESITDPSKPTKPLAVACGDCGGTGTLLSGQTCSDCRGSGYL